MARTYKKAARTEAVPEPVRVPEPEIAEPEAAEPEVTVTAEKPAETRQAGVRTAVKTPAKVSAKAADSVIAAPDDEVMQKIVYQPSSQILTRQADPNEAFGVGDDMPIYYL